MIKVLGDHEEIDNNDPENSRHYFLCDVTDDISKEHQVCYQSYDGYNDHPENVGFKAGPIVKDNGHVIHGHTLLKMAVKENVFRNKLEKLIDAPHDH